MTTTITDTEMVSVVSPHVARRGETGWAVSWLVGRVLDFNQAVSAMALAETAAQMQADDAFHGHRLWTLLDHLAEELGLPGPAAFVRATTAPHPIDAFCPCVLCHDRRVVEGGGVA